MKAPAPAHVEVIDHSFRLVFDLPRTTWRSAETIDGTAELQYGGVGVRLLYGSGVGLLGFQWSEVDGTREGGWAWNLDCSRFAISAAAPLSKKLALGAAWTPEDPEASFYAGMDLSNPRLPPGDYLLGAVARFTDEPCSNAPPPPGAREYDIATPTIPVHIIP